MDPSLHETEAGHIPVTEEGAESHRDVSEVTQVVSGRQHHPGLADPGGQDFNRHFIPSFSLTGISLPAVKTRIRQTVARLNVCEGRKKPRILNFVLVLHTHFPRLPYLTPALGRRIKPILQVRETEVPSDAVDRLKPHSYYLGARSPAVKTQGCW